VAVAAYTDAGSRMTGKTFANGISETWSYDPNRRLSEILSRSSAAALRDVQYQRSPIGNKLAILRPDLSKQATYRFNPNSWITNESLGVPLSGGSAQVSTDYTPDKTLNYTSITRNGQTISITVNGRNQYATFGGESLGYDRNGNLLSLHGIGLAYDFENHLRKATLPDGSTVENLYDGQGRKLEEKITVSGTSTTRDYVLSGDQVVEEYQNGVLSARYVHGRDIDEIVRVEQNANANQDGTLDRTLYPIQDDLGNVERLTDANGLTAERYEYEGYGKPSIFDASGNVLSSSAYNWRWLFQGREYGSLLNAYDFRARHLWPELGRFGQEDPAGTRDSQNGYQGLLGEWNSRSDPTGELTVIVHGTRAQGSFDFMPGGRFFESVRKTMKDEEVVSFQWSGLDNHAGRRIGGERLAADIKAHSFKPGEPLNIIAHSHGGNVVIWAMNLGLGHPVTNFVTLGTPYRDGYRVRDLSYVLNWVNLFNIHDKVQINGGGEYRETGMETGPAGRHHPGATINISWGKNCGPMDSHSALHTPEAWDLVVSSLKNIPTKKPQRSRIAVWR
jgi:RHS repeat-associated protein